MVKNWETTQAYIVRTLEEMYEAERLGLDGGAHAHLKEYMELFKDHVSWRKAVTRRIGKAAKRHNKVEDRLLTRDEVFGRMRIHEQNLDMVFKGLK